MTENTPTPNAESRDIRPGTKPDEWLLFDHGFVRLDSAMADDLSVVNSARVSFAVRKEVMDERDKGLIKFLMREHHGTPFEHNSFRFHVRAPIFVAREWFRHRVSCLTEDTEITFVDPNGGTGPRSRKSVGELWRMWADGESNGHALDAVKGEGIVRMVEEGQILRSIARTVGVGRNTITRILVGGDSRHRTARRRVRRMRLRVLDENTGEFTIGHISEVIPTGVQPVYKLTLDDGKSLTATETHRLLTSEGWATLRDAVGLVGSGPQAYPTRDCSLMTNGQLAYRDREWFRARRSESLSVQQIADRAGGSYHTIRSWLMRHDLSFTPEEVCFKPGHRPWNKGRPGYRLQRRWTPAQKDAIRAARSGRKSNFWRGGITPERASIARWTTERAPKVHALYDYTCQVSGCGARGSRLRAHHIVPVWASPARAYDISDLITVCDPCHRRIHRSPMTELRLAEECLVGMWELPDNIEVPKRRYKLTARPAQVVSVEYVGLRQTYDLTVDGPWHNFVANGIVVHNSFNEESARYHQLASDFYIPQPNNVRTQVGKPGAYHFEPVADDVAKDTIETFNRIYDETYRAYERLIDAGVAKEVARSLLPIGVYTQFYWTINARSLMNFIALRNAESAQYEIRMYAEAVERLFATRMPLTHACFAEFDRKVP